MPRAKNKEELLEASDTQYRKLMDLVDSFSPEEQEGAFLFEDRDKNIRDVLVHLHEWHLMMQRWYKDGMAGEKPAIPAEGYTWKTLPDLNAVIWEKWQGTSLAETKLLLAKSHAQIEKLMRSHSDEELFTKKYYPWTGTTSLGAYFVSNNPSHYDWAMKKIRRQKRALAET
jgi:hypothetical protein